MQPCTVKPGAPSLATGLISQGKRKLHLYRCQMICKLRICPIEWHSVLFGLLCFFLFVFAPYNGARASIISATDFMTPSTISFFKAPSSLSALMTVSPPFTPATLNTIPLCEYVPSVAPAENWTSSIRHGPLTSPSPTWPENAPRFDTENELRKCNPIDGNACSSTSSRSEPSRSHERAAEMARGAGPAMVARMRAPYVRTEPHSAAALTARRGVVCPAARRNAPSHCAASRPPAASMTVAPAGGARSRGRMSTAHREKPSVASGYASVASAVVMRTTRKGVKVVSWERQARRMAAILVAGMRKVTRRETVRCEGWAMAVTLRVVGRGAGASLK